MKSKFRPGGLCHTIEGIMLVNPKISNFELLEKLPSYHHSTIKVCASRVRRVLNFPYPVRPFRPNTRRAQIAKILRRDPNIRAKEIAKELGIEGRNIRSIVAATRRDLGLPSLRAKENSIKGRVIVQHVYVLPETKETLKQWSRERNTPQASLIANILDTITKRNMLSVIL